MTDANDTRTVTLPTVPALHVQTALGLPDPAPVLTINQLRNALEAIRALEHTRDASAQLERARDIAGAALAQPDPCEALADALRFCLRYDGGECLGDHPAQLDAARAALAAYEASK